MTIEQWKYGDRTFKVSDRVKAYYEGKWYTGIIISFSYIRENYPKPFYHKKIWKEVGWVLVEEVIDERGPRVIFDDTNHATALIKTDEPVKDSKGLLDGYGLCSTASGRNLIFEHEEEYEPTPAYSATRNTDDADDEDKPLPF